jgi:hypothetical protein
MPAILDSGLTKVVAPGLDPGVHLFEKEDGWPGERAIAPIFDGLCPAMTLCI